MKLYLILHPHLVGEVDRSRPVLEYIREIVDSMKEHDPYAYLDTMSLLTGMGEEELQAYSSNDILEMFITGLATNQIVLLNEFGQSLGMR